MSRPVVLAVLADGLDTGVVHGLQEAVAVVEKVGALVVELADHLQWCEVLSTSWRSPRVLVQQIGALLEAQALGIPAVVGHMAEGLVGQQVT